MPAERQREASNEVPREEAHPRAAPAAALPVKAAPTAVGTNAIFNRPNSPVSAWTYNVPSLRGLELILTTCSGPHKLRVASGRRLFKTVQTVQMTDPTSALELANAHFQGRKGMLEVVTDSVEEVAADNGFIEPAKPRARRVKRIVPTVPQGGLHPITSGNIYASRSASAEPTEVVTPPQEKPRARRG